jgi:hypothetical protein
MEDMLQNFPEFMQKGVLTRKEVPFPIVNLDFALVSITAVVTAKILGKGCPRDLDSQTFAKSELTFVCRNCRKAKVGYEFIRQLGFLGWPLGNVL